ncbi:MAG TPA: FmdE family protein, partial [Polyangiaceae bacterium]|nr:FmdE family protein [Polyangiaceae bacterium]
AHARHGGAPHAMASGAHSPHDGSPHAMASGAHSPHGGSPHAMASGAHAPHAMTAAAPAGDAEGALRRVADVHGEAGPWAVAGYRMGRYALSKLGLGAQSFDLDVTHKSPASPQYACIADGAAAATGASVGKLNLHHVEGSLAELATTYRRRSTGQTITLRPSPAFVARFEGRPRPALAEAGREAMGLRDDEIFLEVPK